MTSKLKIRPYEVKDKLELLALLKMNVPKYFAESEIADLEHYLNHETEQYFVADLNGSIIGAGGINFENDYKIAKISWDFLHPDFQRMGIGAQLLQHRLHLLHSMETVEIISVRTSQHAYKFYEKNGFVLKETIKDYWAPGFDLYKMQFESLK